MTHRTGRKSFPSKRLSIALHGIALLSLFCIVIADGIIIGRSPDTSAVILALATILPVYLGRLMLWLFIPAIILALMIVFAIRRRSGRESWGWVVLRIAIAACYLIALEKIQSIAKRKFLEDFKDAYATNLILYKHDYRLYHGDIMPEALTDSNQQALIKRNQDAESDTGILINGTRYLLWAGAVNDMPFRYSYADGTRSFLIPLAKLGVHYDSTEYPDVARSEDISSLPFAYHVVAFKMRSAMGREEGIFGQNLEGKGIFYYGYSVQVRFINKDLLRFELLYLVCYILGGAFVVVAIVTGFRNARASRRGVDDAEPAA